MVNKEHIAKLVKIIVENDDERITPYYGYSGRGMYGAYCFGFTAHREGLVYSLLYKQQ